MLETSILGESGVQLKDYVEGMCLMFYNVNKIDPAVHSNKLQPTQMQVPQSNPFLFPSQAYESEELLVTLRIRICVAPNTKVLFSQKKMLTLLGFQTEKRVGYKYEFVNPSLNSYMYFVAENPPTLKFFNYGKINAAVLSNTIVTPVQNISMTLREKRSNNELFKHLKKMIDSLTNQTNIQFDVVYDSTEEKFQFKFTTNDAIKTTLFCVTDLSNRLGFGVKREINATDVSTPVKNVIEKSSEKAKILAFDTGHVIITCFNTSSNQTSISNNQYMASLLPDHSGIMTISPCYGEYPNFIPPNYEHNNQNTVPLLCNMLKFNDIGEPVLFQWKTGAYISGILQGKV